MKKLMKKFMEKALILSMVVLLLTSCATVLGGKITKSQKTKPDKGEPKREIRVGALVADILLFWPGTIVDFATGAIYKPDKKMKK